MRSRGSAVHLAAKATSAADTPSPPAGPAETSETLPTEVVHATRERAKWKAGLWQTCVSSTTLDVPPDDLSEEKKKQWVAGKLDAAVAETSDKAVEKRIAELPPHLRPGAAVGLSALGVPDYAAMYRGHAVTRLNRSRLGALRAARPRERAPARRRRGSATSRGGSSGDREPPPADLARPARASRRGGAS